MARELNTAEPGFETAFEVFVSARRGLAADVDAAAAAIIAEVRSGGDEALIALGERFDGVRLTPATLRVPEDEIAACAEACPEAVAEALAVAARRIGAFHRRLMPEDLDYRDDLGVRLGARWTPIEAVGLYVPGGTAAYPSSVLMNALPARIAGVSRLVMAMPTPGGRIDPAVAAAVRLAGVDEVYRIGGAQAVAALAFGTRSVPRVDKIVGPGNAYVNAAKRRVFGTVGVDMIAGPSEIVVVADEDNDPGWLAADLLSQAEHDRDAQAVLIAASERLAAAVGEAVERRLPTLARHRIAAASWRDHGALIVDAGLGRAAELVDRLAPEHLELALAEPDPVAARVRHAGAIFLGRFTPEAIGDYVGGPNHVLPTARSARFASGLSVFDFLKRTTLLGCDAGALARLGPAAAVLADTEGLGAHALSVRVRLRDP